MTLLTKEYLSQLRKEAAADSRLRLARNAITNVGAAKAGCQVGQGPARRILRGGGGADTVGREVHYDGGGVSGEGHGASLVLSSG